MSGGSAGVQVVRLGLGDGRYELDEAALRNLLLRPDVRDLPVVVVSVAGAYRGGKSFILDFFLRYLNAPRSSQMSCEWLGNEEEPLTGFHWRGGGERDTTGIHLWPETIITTMDTGEKVAVLLMDTQGTFDSETTLGQNSAIFALSTLISSVQVYNLSGNIREDDLQNLQLFTEYGKLVSGAEGKAFQKLLFLVRDWTNPYEHAHGFAGGKALLDKRLQSYPRQKSELREVREHIRSCFDQIQCFLMPHPGLAIQNQHFSGRLCDLTEMFRLALLELVPSLFDVKHLTPKLINGERVRTEELFEYFQQYVNIFNSDEIPEAVTIYQGTAQACLLAAARAARSLYAARMEERMSGGRSMTDRALAAAHDAARGDAKFLFEGKKKLCSQQDADAQLEELVQELDDSLSVYKLKNEELLRETMSLARQAYDATISKVCGEQTRLCLHPGDLGKLHSEAVQEALTLFDAGRNINEGEEDNQRSALVQSLEQQYVQLCANNEQNNNSAVLEARDLYETSLRTQMGSKGISTKELEAHNIRAINEAKTFFYSKRNRETQQGEDCYIQKLQKELNDSLSVYKLKNEALLRETMSLARQAYDATIRRVCGEQSRLCLHPNNLASLHGEAFQEALTVFGAAGNDLRPALVQSLEQQYVQLRVINEQNNRNAVLEARDLYETSMRSLIGGKGTNELEAHNTRAINEAKDLFYRKRNRETRQGGDCYIQKLLEELRIRFEEFKKVNEVNTGSKMEAMVDIYNNYITSVWNPPTCCFHPEALEYLHKLGINEVVDHFRDRSAVTKKLAHRLLELRSINHNNNNEAVDHALGVYTLKMNKRVALPGTLLWKRSHHYNNGRRLQELERHHDDCKNEAIKEFKSRRFYVVRTDIYNNKIDFVGNDIYYNKLEQKIELAYTTTYKDGFLISV